MTTFTLNDLDSGVNNGSGGPRNLTGSAASSGTGLFVLMADRDGNSHANHTCTDSNGTWTKIWGIDNALGDAFYRLSASLWFRPSVSADTSSFTVTADCNNLFEGSFVLFEAVPSAAYNWTLEDYSVAGSGTADLNPPSNPTSGSTGSIASSDLFELALAGTKERGTAELTTATFVTQTDDHAEINLGVDYHRFVYAIEASGQASGVKIATLENGYDWGNHNESGFVGIAVFSGAEASPDVDQTTFQFYQDDDVLHSYSYGSVPVIEAADVTQSGNETASAPSVAYPAYSTGDLIIQFVAVDQNRTITPPATGPNSETRYIIVNTTGAGTNGPALCAIYWVATAGQSSGSTSWSLSTNDSWDAQTIRVPAGEFNPNNPIDAISALGASNTDSTVATMPSFFTGPPNSRVVAVGGVDVDPMDATFSPTGWTDLVDRDIGSVCSFSATRNAGTTAGETVASADFGINITDSYAVVGFTVTAPFTEIGATPIGAENANPDLDVDTTYRWRVRIEESGGVTTGEDTWKIQYKHIEGTNTWTDVTSSSSVIRATLTSHFANGDDVPAFFEGAGEYVVDNNAALESSGSAVLSADLGANEAVELELSFQVRSADVANDDTIQLRVVYSDGTALTTYTNTPTITVVESGTSDDLTATGITTTPVVGTPALTQVHALTATGITTTPTVGTPALTQVHDLTATGIDTGAPTVGTPVVTHVHDLTATGVDTGAPVVGTPAITQVHDLTATGITTTPTVGTPAITQVHDLTATGITATPVVGTPAITQVHDLTATGITATPVVGTPAITQVHDLTATGVDTGAPVVGTPAITQVHDLTATGITATPVVGTPALTQVHDLTATGITATPVVGTPNLSETNTLEATGIDTGAPTVGTPAITQVHALTATGITATPVVGTPAITQVHDLTATGIDTGAPVVGTPIVAEGSHNLEALSIDTGSPVVGTPAITQVHDLTATGITATPVVGTPAITQVHALSATGITTTPTVGTPVLAEEGSLVAEGITTTPVVGTPALTQVHALTATGITTTPVVGTPVLTQVHDLTATGITATPVVGTPVLTQVHALTATGITATPVVGTPAITQVHDLTATGITATPVVGTPALTQVHDLTATGIDTGAPTVGSPSLSESAYSLVATGIDTGAPTVGTPVLTQVHALTATGITTTPVVGTPALTQVHDLTATGITATPVVGTPELDENNGLVATGITTTPIVGTPVLGQIHNLTTSGITVTPVVGAPLLGQIHDLSISGITLGAPTVGSPVMNGDEFVVIWAEFQWLFDYESKVS